MTPKPELHTRPNCAVSLLSTGQRLAEHRRLIIVRVDLERHVLCFWLPGIGCPHLCAPQW